MKIPVFSLEYWLVFSELTADTIHTLEYVNGGQTLDPNEIDLESAIWAVPRRIKEHSRLVAASGGGHIAAIIQSWTPVEDCDFNFIRNGAHPDTTEDRFNELRNSLIGTVSELVEDVPVDPSGIPLNIAPAAFALDQEAQDAATAARQTIEDAFEDLDRDLIVTSSDSEETLDDRLEGNPQTGDTGTSSGPAE